MKALSPLVGMVLVIAFSFTAVTIAVTVVNPMINRAKDAGNTNTLLQQMQLLDSAVKAVAAEAQGSKRTISVNIPEGSAVRTTGSDDWLYIDFEPRSDYSLEGTSGDIQIENSPVLLSYFNHYSDGNNATDAWTIVNGTWSVSSGRFLGTGGIAYKNVGTQKEFEIAGKVLRSTDPDGQIYVVPGDPKDLVLFLPFDGNVNSSVATTYDYSAYNNHGRFAGDAGWTVGKFGNGTDTGSSKYVNVTDSSQLDISDQLTLRVWVRIP